MVQVQLCALEELIWSRLLSTDRHELLGEQEAKAACCLTAAYTFLGPSLGTAGSVTAGECSSGQTASNPLLRCKRRVVALALQKLPRCF